MLLLAALWGLGRLPVERVRREVVDTRDRLSGLIQVLDLPTPLPPTPTTARVAAVLRTATPMIFPTIVVSPTLTETISEPVDAEAAAAGLVAITTTLTVTPTQLTQSAMSVTQTVAPTLAATQIMTATAPVPATTASPTRAGTPTAVSAAAAKAGGVAYVVKAGDTLSGIGLQFGVPWEEIASANDISLATGLQIGQMLQIPVAGASRVPTETPRPKASPRPATATPTTVPMLSAPILESPAAGERKDGELTEIDLRWQPVSGIPAAAQYQVTIEWNEGGQKQSYVWYTTSVAQRLPTWLWGRADQPGRSYDWFVTVVQLGTDGKGGERVLALSPPSSTRAFEWQ
jgi:LysM repeat protein